VTVPGAWAWPSCKNYCDRSGV